MISLKQFSFLLRLSHWSKAAFVFLGVIYSGSSFHLVDALLAALAFCLISSAVYIYNDLQDREEDKLHPYKCRRPLVTGEVSLDLAVGSLCMLLIVGLLIGWLVSPKLAALLGAYLLVNLAYNHLFKNFPVVDVLCIASGFMLRVLAGTIGIGLPISAWLTVTATLVSLLIALCKRRLEKQLGLNDETRLVLKKYSSNSLDLLINISSLGCFFAYLAYIVLVHKESFYFLLTLPFVAIGLRRFVRLAMRVSDNDDPVSLFFRDNLSRFNLLCFLFLTLLALTR